MSNENPPSDSWEYSDQYALLLRLIRVITVRKSLQQLSKSLENSNDQKPALQLCKLIQTALKFENKTDCLFVCLFVCVVAQSLYGA